ncbi:unnamed protein product [Orchesella dallaii]|uniref:Glycosyltransferase family 92 protein n=1 Tax=Orchesella dallaii TaxID=48710 RepID=A0ABP1PMC4_9HEXA
MVYLPCRNRQFLRVLFVCISLITLISIFRTSLPETSKRVKSVIDPIVNFKWEKREAITTTAVAEEDESEEDEDWALDEANVPDIAFILGTNKQGPRYSKPNCAKFPDLFTVRFSNTHWQFQETEEEIYYFYGAYLDMRGNNESEINGNSTVVRVLGMSDALLMNENNATVKFCQLWFEDKHEPEFTEISQVRMIWNYKWGRGHYYPYLITCQLPSPFKQMPVSVSVVSIKCENATNNLNIMHTDRVELSKRTPQKMFGVCVKALDFPHGYMLTRLVEWIEALRLLGADKIFFYEFFVDSEIKKVLDYYEDKGIIHVTQTSLPGELPNHPQLRHLYIRGKKSDKRLTELIPYNDCILRNMYDYKYVAVLDTDEIIMPTEERNWTDLIKIVNTEDIGLQKIQKEPISTYCSRNYYFLDGMLHENYTDSEIESIPDGFHMLKHVYRSNNHTGMGYMKCFHSTEHTLGVHNHFAFFCRGKRCKRHYFDLERAHMNHYRSTCVPEIKNCSKYLMDTDRDTGLWRYKDVLINRVQTILETVAK